ncbi:MAG TPA: hypothetical protein VE196_04425 [Pseudonocardiaceae bacterium]|nr:hypothetical protein [Pseudonocardiaceae bacterium]
MLPAHGVGTRADLPLPPILAVVGGALVLVITFAVLAVLWRRPKFTGGKGGRPVPAGLQRALDAPLLRTALQGATLAAVTLVCVIGLAGPQVTEHNLTPWVFYITFWVGLVPASLLCGPVWRVLNPLRLVHTVLAAVLRLDPARGLVALPERVGYWPAAVSIIVFAWMELVYPHGSEPATVAVFVLGYAVVHTVAALLVGRRWFERGDGFEVYSALLGAMAPIGRRTDGRLVLRNPFEGLDAIRPAPGLVGVVVALVGSTAYDGLSHTSWWNWNVPTGTVNATIELVCTVLLIALIYLLGTWSLVGPGEQQDGPRSAAAFAHSIVPIAAGYAIAHYFSVLFFESQQAFILSSDPFGKGWNLFGTAGSVIDYTIVGIPTIALVQIFGIVTGHLMAAVCAHERAVQLFPPRAARSVQYPLLAAMVGLTMGAVGLVFAG